jgi:HEAT repeat protein
MRVLPWLMTFGLAPAWLSAQLLEQRVATAGTGTVRFSFAAHSGVCSSGNGIDIQSESEEWENDCGPQQVRVSLRVDSGRVVGIRTYVGGRWREGKPASDIGTVRPQEAAAYLISLAERARDLAGDPVLPAALADSVTIWPSLLRLARTATLPHETRRTAVFWVGQAAEAAAGQALDSIAADRKGDREVRKQAVFALAQRSEAEGVPALIRIARNNPDPEIRKTALFWLGQSEDPRALALFEEMLR